MEPSNIELFFADEVQSFLAKYRYEPAPEKLVFKSGIFPTLVPKGELIDQINAFQKFAKKFPEIPIPKVVPSAVACEQASSAALAHEKFNGLCGNTAIDLTGGLGIDTLQLSKQFQKVYYNDLDSWKAECARHNLPYWNPDGKFSFWSEDAIEVLRNSEETFNLIFLDPSRREKGNVRLKQLEDYQPNLREIIPICREKGDATIVKLSPMDSIVDLFSGYQEINGLSVIGLNRECKELLAHVGKSTESRSKFIRVIERSADGREFFEASFESFNQPNSSFSEPQVGQYLFDPVASLKKSGLEGLLTSELKINSLGANLSLYVSDLPTLSSFNSFFRKFVIVEKSNINAIKKQGAKGLSINLITRNFPIKTEELRKQFKLKEGGVTFWFVYKNNKGESILLVAKKVS